jgi:hypothetical protein
VQESSSRLRVGESSGRIKPSKSSKEAQESCAMEPVRRCFKLGHRRLSTVEIHLATSCRSPCEEKDGPSEFSEENS